MANTLRLPLPERPIRDNAWRRAVLRDLRAVRRGSFSDAGLPAWYVERMTPQEVEEITTFYWRRVIRNSIFHIRIWVKGRFQWDRPEALQAIANMRDDIRAAKEILRLMGD